MNFIPAWFTDYPFAPATVFFVPAVLLFVLDVWDYKWGLMYDGCTHFWIRAAYIAAFILSGLFAVSAAV